MSAKGSNSTLTNTDTSSATTLVPAADAAEREAKTASQETSDDIKGAGGVKYPEGSGGQPEFPGKVSADGYSGGSTAAKAELSKAGSAKDQTPATQSTSTAEGGSTGASSGTTGSNDSTDTSSRSTGPQSDSTIPSTSSDDNAKSNTDTAPGYITDVHAQQGKPKGKNLTEGGFDSNPENNASFNSEIGTENDPGRAAELQFQNKQAGTVGTGPKQSEVTGDGQYDVLETEQSL